MMIMMIMMMIMMIMMMMMIMMVVLVVIVVIIIVWLSDEPFTQDEMQNKKSTIKRKMRNEEDAMRSLRS